jgi:hypothetical protein
MFRVRNAPYGKLVAGRERRNKYSSHTFSEKPQRNSRAPKAIVMRRNASHSRAPSHLLQDDFGDSRLVPAEITEIRMGLIRRSSEKHRIYPIKRHRTRLTVGAAWAGPSSRCSPSSLKPHGPPWGRRASLRTRTSCCPTTLFHPLFIILMFPDSIAGFDKTLHDLFLFSVA